MKTYRSGLWWAHDDDGTGSFAGDPPGRAAHSQAPGVFVAGGADHDQVHAFLLGELDQRSRRMPAAQGCVQGEARGSGRPDGEPSRPTRMR